MYPQCLVVSGAAESEAVSIEAINGVEREGAGGMKRSEVLCEVELGVDTSSLVASGACIHCSLL